MGSPWLVMCRAVGVRLSWMVVCGVAKSSALASRLWMAWRRSMGSPCRMGWAGVLSCRVSCLAWAVGWWSWMACWHRVARGMAWRMVRWSLFSRRASSNSLAMSCCWFWVLRMMRAMSWCCSRVSGPSCSSSRAAAWAVSGVLSSWVSCVGGRWRGLGGGDSGRQIGAEGGGGWLPWLRRSGGCG